MPELGLKKRLQLYNTRESMIKTSIAKQNDFVKILFVLMLGVYILHEGCQLHAQCQGVSCGKGFFLYISSMDNFLDTCLILTSIFYLCTLAYNKFVLSFINVNTLKMDTNFISLNNVVNLEKNIQIQCNLMLFIAFLKALNLLKFNPKTYLITDTIRSGIFDLCLSILFVLFNYIVFGILGHHLFINDPQFYDIRTSIFTSIMSIVRHIEYDFLIEKNFFWLFLWQLLTYLYLQRTLINFVISVIISYFDQVRLNHKKSQTEQTFSRIVASALEYFK